MSEAYERDSFFTAYLKWHYRGGLAEFLAVAQNFLWFVSHFFSFKLLSKTLFQPWKRLGEHYEGGFNLEAFASTVLVNFLMRLVGFVTRMVILGIGLIVYLFVLGASLLVLMVWLLAPVVILGGAVLSVTFFTV
jgi:hypothetical protein